MPLCDINASSDPQSPWYTKQMFGNLKPVISPFCRFFIARHGQTEWNAQKRLQGHGDSPLTALGLSQASQLAKLLKDIEFCHAYSSDLLRAQRTAEIILKDREMAVLTTQLLREKSHGSWEGRQIHEFEAALQQKIAEMVQLSLAERLKFQLAPDIETDESVVTRLITFLREVAAARPGENVLVITHSGSMRSLLVHLGFASYEELPPGSIKNLGTIVLDSDGVEFKVQATHNINKS